MTSVFGGAQSVRRKAAFSGRGEIPHRRYLDLPFGMCPAARERPASRKAGRGQQIW